MLLFSFLFKFVNLFFDKRFIRFHILESLQIIKIFMNFDRFSSNRTCWLWYKLNIRWIIQSRIKWIITSKIRSSITRLLTLFLCSLFRILINVFYSSFQCFSYSWLIDLFIRRFGIEYVDPMRAYLLVFI